MKFHYLFHSLDCDTEVLVILICILLLHNDMPLESILYWKQLTEIKQLENLSYLYHRR